MLTLLFSHPTWSAPRPRMTDSSIAVYLHPARTVPTGHYRVEHLQEYLKGYTTLTWVYVKASDGQTGWTLKHELMDSLEFSSKARLAPNSSKYSKPNSSAFVEKTEQGMLVELLDRKGDWHLASHKNETFWVLGSQLYPISKDPGYFFVNKRDQLREKPQIKSKFLAKLSEGSRLKPIKLEGQWYKVSYKNKKGTTQSGYIQTKNLISRLDIAMKVRTSQGYQPAHRNLLNKKVYEIFVNPLWLGTGTKEIPLYESPSRGSMVLTTLEPWSNLTQQNSTVQRWNKSLINRIGLVWWQMENDSWEAPKSLQLAHDKIKNTLKNPLFPHLRFATANGLFRSTDGKNWTAIKGFEKSNPAMTFSSEGVLFVDDKVSYDNGENFQPFIHWEALFKSLKQERISQFTNSKIISLKTLNDSSDQIVMELDIGRVRPVRAYTTNRGRTWSILKL